MKPTVAVVVLAPLLAACMGTTSGESGPCVDALDQPVDVITRPQVEEASESASNFVLDVTSNFEKPVRLTVRFDGKLALDVSLPGTPSECSHPTVYSYAYDLPSEPVTVTAVTDGGERSATTLEPGAGKQWAVVQLQDGFPLQVRTWDSEPAWG
jgi:hypothetical protein